MVPGASDGAGTGDALGLGIGEGLGEGLGLGDEEGEGLGDGDGYVAPLLLTSTVKLAVPTFPAESVAIAVIVWVPSGYAVGRGLGRRSVHRHRNFLHDPVVGSSARHRHGATRDRPRRRN
jgi:hypothetical protein